MARRVRLLIYEGPENWIQYQREHDGVRGIKRMQEWSSYKGMAGSTIQSIELDPLRITLVEVARVLVLGWRERWYARESRWWSGAGRVA